MTKIFFIVSGISSLLMTVPGLSSTLALEEIKAELEKPLLPIPQKMSFLQETEQEASTSSLSISNTINSSFLSKEKIDIAPKFYLANIDSEEMQSTLTYRSEKQDEDGCPMEPVETRITLPHLCEDKGWIHDDQKHVSTHDIQTYVQRDDERIPISEKPEHSPQLHQPLTCQFDKVLEKGSDHLNCAKVQIIQKWQRPDGSMYESLEEKEYKHQTEPGTFKHEDQNLKFTLFHKVYIEIADKRVDLNFDEPLYKRDIPYTIFKDKSFQILENKSSSRATIRSTQVWQRGDKSLYEQSEEKSYPHLYEVKSFQHDDKKHQSTPLVETYIMIEGRRIPIHFATTLLTHKDYKSQAHQPLTCQFNKVLEKGSDSLDRAKVQVTQEWQRPDGSTYESLEKKEYKHQKEPGYWRHDDDRLRSKPWTKVYIDVEGKRVDLDIKDAFEIFIVGSSYTALKDKPIQILEKGQAKRTGKTKVRTTQVWRRGDKSLYERSEEKSYPHLYKIRSFQHDDKKHQSIPLVETYIKVKGERILIYPAAVLPDHQDYKSNAYKHVKDLYYTSIVEKGQESTYSNGKAKLEFYYLWKRPKVPGEYASQTYQSSEKEDYYYEYEETGGWKHNNQKNRSKPLVNIYVDVNGERMYLRKDSTTKYYRFGPQKHTYLKETKEVLKTYEENDRSYKVIRSTEWWKRPDGKEYGLYTDETIKEPRVRTPAPAPQAAPVQNTTSQTSQSRSGSRVGGSFYISTSFGGGSGFSNNRYGGGGYGGFGGGRW